MVYVHVRPKTFIFHFAWNIERNGKDTVLVGVRDPTVVSGYTTGIFSADTHQRM
jgi:hypothetical protein